MQSFHCGGKECRPNCYPFDMSICQTLIRLLFYFIKFTDKSEVHTNINWIAFSTALFSFKFIYFPIKRKCMDEENESLHGNVDDNKSNLQWHLQSQSCDVTQQKGINYMYLIEINIQLNVFVILNSTWWLANLSKIKEDIANYHSCLSYLNFELDTTKLEDMKYVAYQWMWSTWAITWENVFIGRFCRLSLIQKCIIKMIDVHVIIIINIMNMFTLGGKLAGPQDINQYLLSFTVILQRIGWK